MTSIQSILTRIEETKEGKDRILVAIDGRCASGKTTLAGELSAVLHCPLIHADDFFLRPEQRTPERLAEPGGNLDRERFLEEVLLPLTAGKRVSYRPFVCKTMSLGNPIEISPSSVVLIEGSYSCHPALRDFYHLRFFLSVDPDAQISRLLTREGADRLKAFEEKWIPMEETYIRECGVTDACVLLNP
jgi:uridine kinase